MRSLRPAVAENLWSPKVTVIGAAAYSIGLCLIHIRHQAPKSSSPPSTSFLRWGFCIVEHVACLSAITASSTTILPAIHVEGIHQCRNKHARVTERGILCSKILIPFVNLLVTLMIESVNEAHHFEFSEHFTYTKSSPSLEHLP